MNGGGNGGMGMMIPMMMMMVCSVSVAGGGYYLYTNQPTTAPPTAAPVESDTEETTTPATTTTTTAAGAVTSETMTPGEYVIRIGSQTLSTPTNCKFKVPTTRTQASNNRSTWKLAQAGSDASGPYYTIQSLNRTFNKICKKQYLAAEYSTCKTPPVVTESRTGDPRQFWRLVKDVGGGYMMQNVSCANGRAQAYLTFAGQKANQKAKFVPRGGTAFSIEAPYSG